MGVQAVNLLVVEAVKGFLNIVPQIKHRSFQEEEEWRFICTETKLSRSFRPGTSMVVPYVEVSIVDKKKPLNVFGKVVVGPTPHRPLSKNSVELLLQDKKIKTCKVELSKSSYRTW